MRNARLDDAQAGRLLGEISITSDMQMILPFKADSKEKLKRFLMRVKEKSGKSKFNLTFKKTKVMASGPTTSWQIDGETMKTVTNFIFLGSETTADGDCSHEIKRCLLLGRKAMNHIDSVLKGRDINLPTKVHMSKLSFSNSYVCMGELDHKES